MLHMLYNIIDKVVSQMARGKSGRIVIEIDPELKSKLYTLLSIRQKTMKEWFVKEAEGFVYQPNTIQNENDSAGGIENIPNDKG